MKLLTRKNQASLAARKWKSQFFKDGKWITEWMGEKCFIENETFESVYEKLAALGPTTTPHDVDSIVPGCSTVPECFNCFRRVDAVLELGKTDKLNMDTFYLCEDCARKAVELFETRNSE